MSNLIKKFNVTINGDSATYEVGADAKNVQFSDEATSPFKQEFVENNDQNIDVPKEIVSKAENRIYGNAYIKNNDWDDIPGTPGFGPTDDIQVDRRTEGAGALTITYGFNSLAKGHHSTAIGFDCKAAGWASHAEGWKTATAQGTNYSHAEGAKTEANHNAAHAEGDAAKAYGYGSHAEGRGTYVYGVGSHVEGMASNIGYADKIAYQNSNTLHGYIYDETSNNKANNDVDVELNHPKQVINGQLSHAEGLDNTIYGACCHAEGMYNTIDKVYASTAMGEANQVRSSASVVMGYKNTLNSGSNNSLILGNNNVNPGYPNSLFLGQYCSVGVEESQTPALVIGSGNENIPSNLMAIRHPQIEVASPTNRGVLEAENIDAHFGSISQGPLYYNGDQNSEKPFWRLAEKPILLYDCWQNFPTFTEDSAGHYVLEIDLAAHVAWVANLDLTALRTQGLQFTRACIAGCLKIGAGYFPYSVDCELCALMPGGEKGILYLEMNKATYQSYYNICHNPPHALTPVETIYNEIIVYGWVRDLGM